MDVALHRIEALPGTGRFAVTFRRTDGSEQSAVVQVVGAEVEAAPASLPDGWRDGDPLAALHAAVQAFAAARESAAPGAAELRDVDGGWDVSLGNVVLDADGRPACTAHGAMAAQSDRYVCTECGAAALLGLG